ncbi:hypothetical protein DFA_04508 [Cavenderia fasciculata]|uniref:Ankyrin repeat-containing protein n=1 Tax=Cavenderia fasciculata TaxID=261658 RepID=F4PPS7_CACFS|nr:uncharacterized protein DFA_04508 [Cavenderia fasciculata]EGG22390.1 hypothetical protein DFA_04508 [Cavenderia fasciculata]|eukprot:XP_004360241.1 hypothetical protein DFA_04508 [Cavenderia fasciculata]
MVPAIELEQRYDEIEKMDRDKIKLFSLLNSVGHLKSDLIRMCQEMVETLKDQQKGVAVAKGGVAAMAGVGAGMSASPLFPLGYGLLILSGVGGAVTSVVDLAVGHTRVSKVNKETEKLIKVQESINTILLDMVNMFLLQVCHEGPSDKERAELSYYLVMVYLAMNQGAATQVFKMIQNEVSFIPIDDRNINGFINHIYTANDQTYVGMIQSAIGAILTGSNNNADAIKSFRNASVDQIKENAYIRISIIVAIGSIVVPTASTAIRVGVGAGIMAVNAAKASGKMALSVVGKVCVIASPVISLVDFIVSISGDSSFVKAIKKVDDWCNQILEFYSALLFITPSNIHCIPRVLKVIDNQIQLLDHPVSIGMFSMTSKGYQLLNLGTTTYYYHPREKVCITTGFGTVTSIQLNTADAIHENPTSNPNHIIVSCNSSNRDIFISLNVYQWKGQADIKELINNKNRSLMNAPDTTLTVVQPTFKSLIRVPYIKRIIFNQITEISIQEFRSQRGTQNNDDDDHDGFVRAKKGKDIVKLPHLAMISIYGMPWNFIKHYLPTWCATIDNKETVLKKRRIYVITRYCSHPNATLDTLQHLFEWSPDYDPHLLSKIHFKELSRNVAKVGNRDVLELLVNKYPLINLKGVVEVASRYGHLSTLQLLNTDQYRRASCDETTMDIVAKNGRLNILMYLHFNRTEGCSYIAMDLASEFGHLDIVKFLHFNRTEGCSIHAMDNAARNGHYEVVKWLHVNRSEGCTTRALDYSASLEITQFLLTNRTEGCTIEAFDNATSRGRLDIIEYLHQNTSKECTSTMSLAIINGHIDIIKFLYQIRTEGFSDSLTIDRVKMNGKCDTIGIIIFLLSQSSRVEFSNLFLQRAIQSGRLDIIQFIHQHYPTSEKWSQLKSLDLACYYNHFEMVKWIHFNRVEDRCSTDSMDSAAMNNNMEMLQFLHLNRTEGCTTDAMDLASMKGHLKIIEFLNDQRKGCTVRAIDEAASNGFLDVVKYLHKNQTGAQQCTSSAFKIPILYPHYDVIDYILDNKLISISEIKNTIKRYAGQETYWETVDLVSRYYNNNNN